MAAGDTLPAICPDLFLDADFDWIIRQVYPIAATVVDAELSTVFDGEYHSQAKRRLETGSGILIVFTAENIDLSAQIDVRCLIKE
jgi:hypothetical protein